MKEKILIVDDDAQILQLMTFFLQDNGFEVTVAGKGSEAIDKALAEKPHLVLLDIMLPDIHGFSLCERIRSTPSLEKTKIIMFSAKLFPQDHALARMAGADGFVTKPFDIYELLNIIQSALKAEDKVSFYRGGHWGKPIEKILQA